MQRLLTLPLTEDAIGQPVNIVGGILAGRAGRIDALPDSPLSRLVVVELDRDGGNVWIDVDHLEEKSNIELYFNRPEIMKTLRSLTERVMRQARKEGEHLIAQTKRGLVALKYNPAKRTYTLTTQDGGNWTASGPRSIISTYIINLFNIEQV